MTDTIEFRDATASDDAQLTPLVSAPLPGDLSLAFCRQPSFLQACAHCGPARRVLAAVLGQQVVALCSYFSRDYQWSDGLRQLWMISDFRALPGVAGKSVTGRGWAELRQRLGGQPALVSLLKDNPRALALFSKPRPGWPRLHGVSDLCTNITPLFGPSGPSGSDGPFQVRPLSGQDIVSHVNSRDPAENGARAQITLSDFGSVLPAEDRFFGVFQGGRLLGCAGLWEPNRYRQVRIHHYRGIYGALHRLGKFLGVSLLPEPGSEVPLSYATLLVCPEPDAFRALFGRLKREARQVGSRFLVWSRPGPEACRWWDRLRFRYHSRIYQLLWEGDPPLPPLKGELSLEVAWL